MTTDTRAVPARAPDTGGYWNPYVAGVVLGFVLFGTYVLTGHGLGASGGGTRAILAIESLLAPGHTASNPYHAQMTSPVRSMLDHWVVWLGLGTILGGFASGLLARRVRLETFRGPRISARTRWIAASIGGAIVGYGAAMARGCTSGQALSGGATLAVGSWVFMFAVFGGGYLLAWWVRRLWT
jgi:uncharacterized membrane protein YedE/YeeE